MEHLYTLYTTLPIVDNLVHLLYHSLSLSPPHLSFSMACRYDFFFPETFESKLEMSYVRRPLNTSEYLLRKGYSVILPQQSDQNKTLNIDTVLLSNTWSIGTVH